MPPRPRARAPGRTLAIILVLLPLLAAGCTRRPPLMPESARMVHYAIPWEGAFPSDVVVDDAGRLWFTDRLTHALGVFDPTTETFERYATPTPRSAPYGLVRAPDGTLWFGESNGGRLGRMDPRTRELEEVAVPGLEKSGPMLLAWSGGAVWFTSREGSGVYGRHDPSSGETRIWRGPVDDRIYGIAATSDGAVWVGPYNGSRLFRVDEGPVSVTTLDLTEPYLASLPPARLERLSPATRERWADRRVDLGIRRIAAAPDGRIWVSGYGRGRVTGIDPDRGATVHVRTVAQPARPYGITVDALGRVWYSEQGNDLLTVYDPRGDRRSALPLPVSGGTVRDIAVDVERGRVWLPLSDIGVLALLELR